MTDVFISYADDDARRVRRIVDGFQAAGCAVFFERESRDNVLWMDATAAQIKQSDAIVVVLSKAAAQSERMAWEVDLAARYGKRLFPAVIESDAPIPKAFTEAVERRRDVFEDPNGARAVRVSPPVPLWRDENSAPALSATEPDAAARPQLEAPTEGAAAESAAPRKRVIADDSVADDLAPPAEPALSAEAAPAEPTNGAAAKALDGEKIRKLVTEVRQSSDAARASAEGPRTSEGLAKSASLVFAQWRAVEDSEDLRRLKTFRTEFADDPYFSERADDRIDALRRERIWSRADFGFRLVTGMALVAAAVWALRESDQLDEVYSTFRPNPTSTAVSSGAPAASDVDEQIADLQNLLGVERARVAELKAMLDQNDPDVAKLQASLLKAEERARTLDRDLARARTTANVEKTRADRALRDLKVAKAAAVDAAAARDKAEADRRRLSAARDEAIAERDAAKDASADAKAALAAGASDNTRIARLSAQRDALQADLAKARRDLTALQKSLADAEAGEQDLKRQVASLRQDVAKARSERPVAIAAAQIPDRAGDGGAPQSSAILMDHFLAKQERVYQFRRRRDGPAAKFPIMSRRDIFRMQACIEQETEYRVGVDGIWGLRTSRAVVGMSVQQARQVRGCLDQS